jgi:hypothetical protein
MPQPHAPSPLRAAAGRFSAPAVLAALVLGCSPALETPPLGPDAASPGEAPGPADEDAGLAGGGGDGGEGPSPPTDGAPLPLADAGPLCAEGDVRACDCGEMRDDGSPIPGLQLCAGGEFEACRCAAPDGGVTGVPTPSCGADAYSGTLTGTLSFAGISGAEVRARSTVTAVELVLLPADSDGRREVSGAIRGTVGGLADLEGELRGHLSCKANPPTLSTLATAGFGWLGTQYTLRGEFTADLTAGTFGQGAWYLGADGGTDPAADGQGSWSASPK